VDGAAARTNDRRAADPAEINMEAGHGGASGRFEFLKEIALDYAFAIWALREDGGSDAQIESRDERED